MTLALFLFACTIDTTSQGTAVGNPTDNAVSLNVRTAAAQDLEWISASVLVNALQMTTCNGEIVEQAVNREIDLLGDEDLGVPAGDWCGVSLIFGSKLSLEAVGPDDSDVKMMLELYGLALLSETPVPTEPGAWVIELGSPGWTSADALGATDGKKTNVNKGSDAYDALILALVEESSLFLDENQDGAVSEDERALGSQAKSSEVTEAEDSERHSDDTGGDDEH